MVLQLGLSDPKDPSPPDPGNEHASHIKVQLPLLLHDNDTKDKPNKYLQHGAPTTHQLLLQIPTENQNCIHIKYSVETK